MFTVPVTKAPRAVSAPTPWITEASSFSAKCIRRVSNGWRGMSKNASPSENMVTSSPRAFISNARWLYLIDMAWAIPPTCGAGTGIGVLSDGERAPGAGASGL